MLLDGIMLVAITGLWLMWWLNAKRQHRVESMLADSAMQLREASHYLRQAMELIDKSSDRTSGRTKSQQRKTSPDPIQKTPAAQEDTQITHMLNMQREGKPVEDISRKLGLPLNQVKLMLKLHASRAH